MKYRITNITKKPGQTKGKFRKGFFVDVKPNGKVRPMWVGEHVVVDEVTPGILAMQKKEYISVEPVEDLNVQIKEQIAKNEAQSRSTIATATKKIIADKKEELDQAKVEAAEASKPVIETTTPSTGLDKEAMKQDAKLKSEKKAPIITGGESDTDPLGDLDSSVNPDGEPNFVVKASTKRKSSRRN